MFTADSAAKVETTQAAIQKWMENKMWLNMHNEGYGQPSKEQILTLPTTWMNLKDIMPSEARQVSRYVRFHLHKYLEQSI